MLSDRLMWKIYLYIKINWTLIHFNLDKILIRWIWVEKYSKQNKIDLALGVGIITSALWEYTVYISLLKESLLLMGLVAHEYNLCTREISMS